ncbi:hypothetical protein D9757_009967 [Collybiopsis confluens]|uniref:SAP domain-containing protein n=1 Tax=Collybiopsis confluens TaxID=2823264 RepID=A0A8H5LZU6_9AGAR|nr:hypothetical protein D9757_009967 [Collybiopsis confluens]
MSTSGELLSRWGSGLLKAARNAAGPFLCWISTCCSSGTSSNIFLTCGGSCKSFSLSISLIIVVAVCVLLRSILAAAMDAKTSASTSPLSKIDKSAYCDVESLNINGQEIRVRRPIEPQPAGTVQLPAQFTGDVFFVRYENLASLTKRATLVQLCKDYQLSSAGNRDVLRERIEGFSENPIQWQNLLYGATRSHRGQRTVSNGKIAKPPKNSLESKKVSKLKRSTIRRNELMGLPLNTPVHATIFGTERSKDRRTLEDKMNFVRLAEEFCKTHPYVPLEEIRRRTAVSEEAKKRADPTTMLSEYAQSTNMQLSNIAMIIGELAGRLSPNLSLFPSSMIIPDPRPSQLAILASAAGSTNTEMVSVDGSRPSAISVSPSSSMVELSPVADICRTASSLALGLPRSSAALVPAASNDDVIMADADADADMSNRVGCKLATTTSEDPLYTIKLGYGQILQFRYSEIPNPALQISFSDNIARLGRVWDDEADGNDVHAEMKWDPADCANLLSINGTPVALRYWCDVYKGKKDRRWTLLKGTWTEWKVLVNVIPPFRPGD